MGVVKMRKKNKKKINKLTDDQKLEIAIFIASIDLYNHFTTWCDLTSDVDYSDLIELEAESLVMEHEGKTLYVVPCYIWEDENDDDNENYVYGVKAYYHYQDSLPLSKYTPTWKEIADELEKQNYPCSWVTADDVKEVMKHFPPELLEEG